MKCPNCKADIVTGRAFCPVCGRKTTLSINKTASPLRSSESRKKNSESAGTRFQRGSDSVLDTFKPIIDLFSHNVWAQRVAAGIVIAVCVGTGIYIKVSDKIKHQRYVRQNYVWQPSQQLRGGQLQNHDEHPNFAGMRPNEVSAWFKAKYDFSQTPRGVRGLKPVGRTRDGRPVFDDMPVYEETPGAFIATICYPGSDPRLPSLSRQVAVPARGKSRDAFRKKIESDFQQCYLGQFLYMTSPERRSEDIQNEIGKMEIEDKARLIRNQDHERELAHVNNMTRDQYIKVRDMDLKRIDNGIPHTDLFYDKRGEVWKVDVNGRAYRYKSL